MPITEATITPAGTLMTRCFICQAPIPADNNKSVATREGQWTCKGECATQAELFFANSLADVVGMISE